MNFKLYGQPVTVTEEGKVVTEEEIIYYAVRVAIDGPPVGPWAGDPVIANLQDSYGAENITDIQLDKDKDDKNIIY